MKPTLSEVLNDTAEWHGAGLGALFGGLLAAGHTEFAGLLLTGVLGAQVKRETHLADAQREMAYFAGGALAILGGSTLL